MHTKWKFTVFHNIGNYKKGLRSQKKLHVPYTGTEIQSKIHYPEGKASKAVLKQYFPRRFL